MPPTCLLEKLANSTKIILRTLSWSAFSLPRSTSEKKLSLPLLANANERRKIEVKIERYLIVNDTFQTSVDTNDFLLQMTRVE